MRKEFDGMTFIQFKDWCNQRVCDGQWGFWESLHYIEIVQYISAIKAKGFFKKKETVRLQELEWRKICSCKL